jgi:hypothetical protein
MNVAYKHLNAKLKIGEFTAGQWGTVFLGIVVMLGWGFYLSPLGPYLTIITAVYLGGVPISLAMLATYAELNVWRFGRCAFVWTRADGTFSPGPGEQTHGYEISPDPRALMHEQREAALTLDLRTLWD